MSGEEIAEEAILLIPFGYQPNFSVREGEKRRCSAMRDLKVEAAYFQRGSKG